MIFISDELLLLGCPSEKNLYVVARFHVKPIGQLNAQVHAVRLALQGVHRASRCCPDEIGIYEWRNLTESGGIDRGHVPSVLVELAFDERVQQAVHHRRRRFDAGDLELVSVRRRMIKSTDRRRRDAYVRAHHEPRVTRLRLVI